MLGQDHPATLRAAGNFAFILRELGETQAARELDEDILIRRRRMLAEYHPMERYDEALRGFYRALEIDLRCCDTRQPGVHFRRTERYDEALRDFYRALEIDPNNAWILGARGLTYQQMERYEAALADLCRSLEIDASDAWLLARRGETYLMSGDYEKGSADLNNALETDPNTVFLVDSLVPGAVGHLKRGEPEAASAIFGAIVSVSPNNSAAHNNYGFCLMPTDPARALDELNHARELGHNKLVNLADIVWHSIC